MTLEFFEEFFTQNPNAVYVVFPSIVLLSIVYAVAEMVVDKARAKNGGDDDNK